MSVARFATTSGSPTSSDTDTSHVLTRLQALFKSSQACSGRTPTPNDPLQDGSSTGSIPTFTPEQSNNEQTSPVKPERAAIKVFIVTWNMGDALPKGELKVLLGEIPPYTNQTHTSGLPRFPVVGQHPYHIVVFAGQECPTHSGVPRGLGGGIMKGVSVRGAGHKKDKEEREEKGVEFEKCECAGKENLPGLKSPRIRRTDVQDEEHESVRPRTAGSSPSPHTPNLHRHAHTLGSKGWSTMLDEWFCGPPVHPGGQLSASSSPRGHPVMSTPIGSDLPSLGSTNDPDSLSAPTVSPSPTEPVPIPSHHLFAPPLSHFPLSRSQSSCTSSVSDSSSEEEPAITLPPGILATFDAGPGTASIRRKPAPRPEMAIFLDPPVTGRSGAYVHLVKERLMGIFLSIYVHKGCEHLVQGVDTDFVTAGLAGGRLGNKGGIGISLKLVDHTFLFVNSHLAAHASRVSARMANIAKIKSELKLDCFLPKDDPRAILDDITDRFDSVFWCGDLNFRLDLSRLHVEWLVEQKKYDEALVWDQLKMAMRDPGANPLSGFEEAQINFPPTFKYDVWKSVRNTNRERKRSMRVRRGTLDGHYDRRTESKSSATVKGGLSHLIETPDANDPEENGKAIVHTDDPTIHDSDVESRADLATRRSFDSVSGTSVAQSTIGTDLDEGEDEDADRHYAVDSSAYGSRHKAFEVAFKQKTKRLLGLVKMDGILTPSSNRQELRIRTARQRYAHKRSQDFDRVSRQASFSSLASGQNDRSFWAEDLAVPAPLPTANLASHQNTDGPSFDLQRSASSALLGTSPRLPLARRLSGLKRTVSGRSIRGTGRPGMIDDPACEDMDDLTDHREGVYDSSRKQRVPSWCDRVLWRGHPVPEPQPSTHSNFLTPDDSQSRPLNRLSNAIANFGGHLRLSRIRTTSIDSTVSPIRVDRPLPPTLPPEQTLTPSAASLGTTTAHVLPQGLIPEPRRSVNRHAMYPSGSETHMQATSTAHHHLADEDIPHPSAPAKPQLTSDLARPVPTASSYSRDWSDGDGAEANRMSPTGPSLIPTHLIVNRGLPVSGPSSASPHTSGGSLSFRKRTSTLEASEAASEPPHHSLPSGAINKDEQNSAIRQFFRDLPNWLPGRSSMLMTGSSLPNEAKSERRRRMKGEIVCLHYGTLDDAGMRQLEGRSDHRPAIFSAAVYI